MPDDKLTTEVAYTELGSSGLKRFAGMVDEDFVRDLERSRSRFKVYREMSFNDPVVSAVLFAAKQVIRNNEWLVEPSDEEDPTAVEYADHVRECKDDMSHTFGDFISDCLSFLEQGWSLFEEVFKKRLGQDPPKYIEDPAPSKYDDGKVGWRKFAPRGQDTLEKWDFDDTGGIQGMIQTPAPTYDTRYVPMKKALLFRTQVEKNNPEGKSVLRGAYRPWYMKKSLEVIMGIGVERNLNGMPAIYLPESFSDKDYTRARELVERVRMDEFYGVTLPGPKAGMEREGEPVGWLFELVNGSSRQTLDVLQILEYYDRRIAMSVLAQFLLLGSTVGSWALSRDQSDLFLIALEGWSQMIADVLNRHAVPKLMRMNNWDEELSPRIVPTPLSRANLAEMSQWIKTMFEVGMPVKDLEDQIRSMADLPPREEDGVEEEEPEEVPELEVEEEEVEKQEDVWHVKGHIPTEDEVESGWEVEESDIEAARREMAELIGEPV